MYYPILEQKLDKYLDNSNLLFINFGFSVEFLLYIACMYRYNKWGIMSKKVKTRNIAYVS